MDPIIRHLVRIGEVCQTCHRSLDAFGPNDGICRVCAAHERRESGRIERPRPLLFPDLGGDDDEDLDWRTS